MSITLYYSSGSPHAWRIQLALEHKALPYEFKALSLSADNTRNPELAAVNPRHTVPTIVDGDFVLYESNAITEYLEDAYPGHGAPLFPGDVKTRATIWRLMMEVDNYVIKATDSVQTALFWPKQEERPQKLVEARAAVTEEFAQMSRYMRGDFLVGPLSAADFSLYPLVAFMYRASVKLPNFGDAYSLLTPELRRWKARMETLPFLEQTMPPHWKQA